MFNLNFYKKKFRKILLPIIKIIESFFTEIDRSKSQSNRQIPLKKKIIHLDSRIESFFDKFKNLKKFNQNKKKLHYLNSKLSISIALIVVLFFSYFFIPAFYNKDEIKKLFTDQISDQYDIDIKFNEKINYGLFPRPYFFTKNLNILFEDDILGKSNYVKFYISFNNFFSLKELKIKDLIFKNTEFNTNSDNIYFFNEILNNLKMENRIIFKKNKLFFRDNNNDLLFLSKLQEINFFHDDTNQLQKLNSGFEIFNIPLKLNVSRNDYDKKKLIELSSRKIRLDSKTTIKHNGEDIMGSFDILFFNKKNSFNYKIENKTLNFLSKNDNFNGTLNLKPFYFYSDLSFDYVSQKKIFNNDNLIYDLLNTDLLYNPNLNAVFNIKINKVEKFDYFKNLNMKVVLGDSRITANDFDVKWNESVSLRSKDIEFLNEKDEKKLIGEIIFDFNDVEKFFRYFQIKRNYRNVFNQIKADFVYDFNENKIYLNNLVVDNKSNKKINSFIEDYNRKENNIFNKVTFRNFVKEFFKIYAG
ncbi:hypothetical protein [Candidatus Pelagibacter sp.]|uniref:hypothetical protein n=1 Tax=Candidatus Pelagibacter sp. TaxID=2024849 RepID=UPI003F857369